MYYPATSINATQPYRFFKADRQISKGKLLATLELLAQGKNVADIAQTLFCTVDSCQKAANGFGAGKKKKAALFIGKSLTDSDIPEAFGAVWAETHK